MFIWGCGKTAVDDDRNMQPGETGTAQNAGLLADESKKYRKKTKDLYHQALMRKYLPLVALVGIVMLFLWIRWYFY